MDKRGATTGSTCEQLEEWRSGAKHATTLLLVSLFPSSSPSTATTPRILASNHPPKLAQLCPNDAHDLYLSNNSQFIHIEKAEGTSVRMYSISSVIALVVSTLALPAIAQNGPNGNLTSLTGTWASGAKNVLTGSVGGILNICWIRILTSFDERASPTQQTKPSHTHRRLVYRTPCTSAPFCVLACSRLTIVCQYR